MKKNWNVYELMHRPAFCLLKKAVPYKVSFLSAFTVIWFLIRARSWNVRISCVTQIQVIYILDQTSISRIVMASFWISILFHTEVRQNIRPLQWGHFHIKCSFSRRCRSVTNKLWNNALFMYSYTSNKAPTPFFFCFSKLLIS